MPNAASDTPLLTTPGGRARARALGIPFDGETGTHNAITDVPGVRVGYTTLCAGHGMLKVGHGPIRTGVTAILPRPTDDLVTPVFAGYSSFNGVGELTGAHFITETGTTCGPMTITNTHSCGLARDASIEWMNQRHPDLFSDAFGLPVAAETYDGLLNDINGFHVRNEHVFGALDSAVDGAIDEGSVGGGTGMNTFEFTAGSGTASRIVRYADATYVVGSFVQSNFGAREQLTIRGHCLGRSLLEPARRLGAAGAEKSSIIAIVATNAPLLPHQLARLARRATVGVARTGGIAHHGSGDIFLAFSTANEDAHAAGSPGLSRASFVPDPHLNAFFEAVVDSVEEAILNSLVANEDMTGRDDNFVPALPHDEVRSLFA